MNRKIHNPNCDGNYCDSENSEVKILETGAYSGFILCKNCFEREMLWRWNMNSILPLDSRFQIKKWEELEAYEQSIK